MSRGVLRPAEPAGIGDGELLVLDRLSKRFGGVTAVDELSLTLRAGEVVGLIGPNGSGKTTLVNLVTGVVAADSGRAFFQGRPLRLGSVSATAKAGVVRLFQEPRVFESLSGKASLTVARASAADNRYGYDSMNGSSGTAASVEAIQTSLIRETNLFDALEQSTSSYSFGQRRLLGMAAVLATGARALLVDEPTAGLSPRLLPIISRVLQEVAATGRGILVVEHNFGFLLDCCSRCAVMKVGRLVALGRASEILQPETFQRYFLR